MRRWLEIPGTRIASRALAAGALAMLASCVHAVIVRDISGLPIERAEIVPSCPSHDFPSVYTDANGRARLDRRYTPDPRWLRVRKSGYESIVVNPYPRSWPCAVTLRPVGA